MDTELSNGDGTPEEAMLTRITTAIVDAVNPRQVILFGSGARGELRTDSDIDLMVVIPNDGQNNIDATSAIYVALPRNRLPTDILVVTPEQIEYNWNNPGCAIRPAIEEGRVLYDEDTKTGPNRSGVERAVDEPSSEQTRDREDSY